MYDLSDVLDVAAMESVQAGTNILISGPAMTGAKGLAREVLVGGAVADEGVVLVTTSETAAEAVADLRDRAPNADPARLCAIDCRSENNGTDEEGTDGDYLYHVSDPSDLTGMGIGITKSFDRLEGYGVERGRVGLTSLSTMLTYTDKQTVFKFCHVLTSRIDAARYVSAFTIDASAHDSQTLQIIKQPFDGLVEIRERDGAREARVLGLSTDPSEWVEL